MNIPVVYEDDWLLVVDKPCGLLCIPTPRNEQRTLTSILNEDLKKRGLSYRLHPCHRLDRETSGLVVYAKGKSVQKKMMLEFKQRKVKKTYIAFIAGIPSRNEGQINFPIDGREAITKYKIIEKTKDFAIVEANPVTGRTNQIRIHFKHIGHPVLGERKYAFRRDFKVKAKRLCLHAKALSFAHPVTGELVDLSCALGAGMAGFLGSRTD